MKATVDIVIPVYNEEQVLSRSVDILCDFLNDNLRNPWQIIIADSVSTDSTRSMAGMLCERYPNVNYLYLPRRGRGLALRAVWLERPPTSPATWMWTMPPTYPTSLI